jgi:hypothetical protein
VPRRSSLTFRYQSDDPLRVLTQLLDYYHASGTDDRFQLVQDGSIFHVVPSRSANAEGIPVHRRSRLDVPVTLEDRERDVFEALGEILQQAGAVNGLQMGVGLYLKGTPRIRVSARQESARTVLVRTLAATGRSVSWRLFCDPSASRTSRMCFLNLHIVDTARR